MKNLDFERLRKDLINEMGAAMFAGGFKMAIIDISNIENTSDEELIKIANRFGFDLNNYISCK